MMSENNSLNNVCYEQIKDSFYYGLFGDFKLVIDKSTGCFNATKLCIDSNKRYRNWARSERACKLFNYYKSCRSLSSASFYEIKLQNNDPLNKQITGQYVRQELILDIASWISVEFYDKCNRIILNYFVNEYKTMDKSEFELKLKDIKDKMENLMLEKDAIQQKLETAVEDRAPQPAKKNMCERFILIKRNNETYPYYTTRSQDARARGVLKRQRSLYTEVSILLDLSCHPNSKTLFVRVRDELKKKGVAFKSCKISLAGSTINEEELIKAMNTINDEKRDI